MNKALLKGRAGWLTALFAALLLVGFGFVITLPAADKTREALEEIVPTYSSLPEADRAAFVRAALKCPGMARQELVNCMKQSASAEDALRIEAVLSTALQKRT